MASQKALNLEICPGNINRLWRSQRRVSGLLRTRQPFSRPKASSYDTATHTMTARPDGDGNDDFGSDPFQRSGAHDPFPPSTAQGDPVHRLGQLVEPLNLPVGVAGYPLHPL
jgi:hypothetical protein